MNMPVKWKEKREFHLITGWIIVFLMHIYGCFSGFACAFREKRRYFMKNQASDYDMKVAATGRLSSRYAGREPILSGI